MVIIAGPGQKAELSLRTPFLEVLQKRSEASGQRNRRAIAIHCIIFAKCSVQWLHMHIVTAFMNLKWEDSIIKRNN